MLSANGYRPTANRGSWDGATVRVVKTFGLITEEVPADIPFAIIGNLRHPVPAVEEVRDPDSGEVVTAAVEEVRSFREEFRALGDPPAKALDAFRAAVSYNDRGAQQITRLDVITFLRDILIPEDEARFDALLDDKNRLVPLRVMYEAALDLFSELTKPRPTGT